MVSSAIAFEATAEEAVPKGLKTLFKRSAPVKLVGRGLRRGFVAVTDKSKRYRGVTKRLSAKLWSRGTLPFDATHGQVTRRGWRGKSGGRRRGIAIDAQLSRMVNRGRVAPAKGRYELTNLALAALRMHRMAPIVAQRGVCDEQQRLATAIDLLCYDLNAHALVVVELKCGHSGARTAPATMSRVPCRMKAPLRAAPDTVLNRHLAQLTATRAMLLSETATLRRMHELGIASSTIAAVLLYVDDAGVTMHTLPAWWTARGKRILAALGT